MPTYEYECRECGHVFDRFQKMSEDALTRCPRCGGEVERKIGAGGGIILKGAGFHATDYGSSGTSHGAGLGASCTRDRPCCGRDSPCQRSPRRP